METHPFKFNENLSVSELKEAVYSHIAKAKGVTSCLLLMRDNEGMTQPMLYNAIWAVDDYLDDLLLFHAKLNEIMG